MQRFSSSLLAFQCSRPFFVRRAAFLTAECSLKSSRSLARRTSPYRRREEEGDWKREGKWWSRWERALQLTYFRFCLCAVTVFMWEKERVSNLQAEASYDRYKRKHRIQEDNVVQSPNGEQSSSSPPNNREQSSSSLPNNGGQSSSSPPNNGGQSSSSPPNNGGQSSSSPPNNGGQSSSPPLPSSPNKEAKPFEPKTLDVQAVFIELEANCNTGSDRHGNRGGRHGNRDGRSKDSSAHVEGAEDKDEVKRRNGTLRMPSLSPALTSSSRRDNTGPDDEMSKEKVDENQGGVWNTLSQMGQATSSFFSNSYDYLYSLISSSSTPSTSASSESQTVQKESSERQAKTEERGKGKEEEQAVIPHSAITADDTMESPKPQSLEESGSGKLSNDASSNLRQEVASVLLTTEGATDEINEKQFLEREKSRGGFAEESPDPLVDGWEFVVEQNGCKVYSKLYKDTGLKQYRVIGAYDDITARDFLEVQLARHEDRKVWDAYALKLDTIDTDKRTGSEVIHWIMKYPFPMSSREYVFVRRAWVSPNEDAAVIISKAVDHPAAPEGKKYVRVKQYYSEMVIKPHSFVDELGFRFELTYFDDPGVYLPSSAVNWVSKTAMPDFLSKMHVAALKKKSSSYSNRQHRSAV